MRTQSKSFVIVEISVVYLCLGLNFLRYCSVILLVQILGLVFAKLQMKFLSPFCYYNCDFITKVKVFLA